jgi:hypothetical protein
MHSWKSIVTLILLVALLAPAAVQARAYQTFTAEVPFEFTVGDHKFKPGTYTFVILGPGLVAVENAKKRVLTTLVTRDIRTPDGSSSAAPHVFFDKQKGRLHLASLWMGDSAKGLEIVGEQVAIPQSHAPSALLPEIEQPRFNMPQPIK